MPQDAASSSTAANELGLRTGLSCRNPLHRTVIKGSVAMLIPSAASLMVAFGVPGKYVGMLNVAADTTNFPNAGPCAWGHVAVLTRGRTVRCSFKDLLKKVATHSEKTGAATTPETPSDGDGAP